MKNLMRNTAITLAGMICLSAGNALALTVGNIGGTDRIPCPEVVNANLITKEKFFDVGQDNRWRDTCLRLFDIAGAKASAVLITRIPPCMPAKSNPTLAPVAKFVRELYLESQDRSNIYRGEQQHEELKLGGDSYREKSGFFGYLGCQKYVPSMKYPPAGPRGSRQLLNYCANQHILAFRSDPKIIIDWRGKPENLTPEYCQKLRLIPVHKDEEEFRVEYYQIRGAVHSATNPSFITDTSIKTILERYARPDGTPSIAELACKHPEDEADLIKEEERNGRKWNNKCDVGETYERIFDPSHPYSPRFDFDHNEREYYSPFTGPMFNFGPSVPSCAVSCAARPVDIMRFRRKKFNDCIMCRMGQNVLPYWIQIALGVPDKEARHNLPCSTRFDLPDIPGACKCPPIESCCGDIRKPVPGINTVKLRPLNEINFPPGTGPPPPGMRFAEWFGEHYPAMRWWDTGAQANVENAEGEDPYNLSFTLDTIMGVGKDGANSRAPGRTCRYGGDGEDDPLYTGPKSPVPQNTTWAEFKMYQSNVMNKWRLSCIGRYEQLFKLTSAEDLVQNRAGTWYQENVDGELIERSWPDSWLGYAGARPSPGESYPIGRKRKPWMSVGLDIVKRGDILVFTDEHLYKFVPNRLPHVAFVTDAYNKQAFADNPEKKSEIKGDWIKVVDFNHGKYPDTCGNTDAMGFGAERTIFLSRFPPSVEKNFEGKNYLTKDCRDPNLAACIATPAFWNNVLVYSPIARFR